MPHLQDRMCVPVSAEGNLAGIGLQAIHRPVGITRHGLHGRWPLRCKWHGDQS